MKKPQLIATLCLTFTLVAFIALARSENADDVKDNIQLKVMQRDKRVLLKTEDVVVETLDPFYQRQYSLEAIGASLAEIAERIKSSGLEFSTEDEGRPSLDVQVTDVNQWELFLAISRASGMRVRSFGVLGNDPKFLDISSIPYRVCEPYLVVLRQDTDSGKRVAQISVLPTNHDVSGYDGPELVLLGKHGDGTTKTLALQKFWDDDLDARTWRITDDLSGITQLTGKLKIVPYRELIRINAKFGVNFGTGNLKFTVSSIDELTRSKESSPVLIRVVHDDPAIEGVPKRRSGGKFGPNGNLGLVSLKYLDKDGASSPLWPNWEYDYYRGLVRVLNPDNIFEPMDFSKWIDGRVIADFGIREEMTEEFQFDLAGN